tara:strand:+ start:3439 stop:3678 length:240 start_codon:yes stop_codon:yes gene_type:complete
LLAYFPGVLGHQIPAAAGATPPATAISPSVASAGCCFHHPDQSVLADTSVAAKHHAVHAHSLWQFLLLLQLAKLLAGAE